MYCLATINLSQTDEQTERRQYNQLKELENAILSNLHDR